MPTCSQWVKCFACLLVHKGSGRFANHVYCCPLGASVLGMESTCVTCNEVLIVLWLMCVSSLVEIAGTVFWSRVPCVEFRLDRCGGLFGYEVFLCKKTRKKQRERERRQKQSGQDCPKPVFTCWYFWITNAEQLWQDKNGPAGSG